LRRGNDHPLGKALIYMVFAGLRQIMSLLGRPASKRRVTRSLWFQVAGNEPTLREGIKAFYLSHLEDGYTRIGVFEHRTNEVVHCRIDDRSYYICEAPVGLADRNR
jgi:hypothetical protein